MEREIIEDLNNINNVQYINVNDEEHETKEIVINTNNPYTRGESTFSDKSFSNNSIIEAEQNNYSDEKEYKVRSRIDIKRNRFPFCLVWTPLPLISWFLPMIGHTGICTSDGKIYDFAGSYFISEDNMAFGNPYKYIELNPNVMEQEQWDECVIKSNDRFTNEEHNICLNNCHSHVAHALNLLNFNNFSSYNMITIWWMFITQSKYVSNLHILKTYIAFAIMLIIIFILIRL